MIKYSFIITFYIIFYTSLTTGSKNVSQDDYSDYNQNVYRKFVKMDAQLKKIAEKSVKTLLPYLIEAREHINLSERCTRNIFDFIMGFRKLTGWSFNCKYFQFYLCY